MKDVVTTNPALHNPHIEGNAFLWEAGPVGIFLSHGFTATASEVRPLAKRLREAGYTVAGPLLPGHGTRPEELNRTHWQDWVRAGDETYQQLAARCKKVFVGGESMGGLVALYLASEYPEAVGVLTYAPAMKLTLSRWERLRLFLSAPFVPSVAKEDWQPCPGWQGYRVNPLRAAVQLLRMGKEVKARLPHIHQPVLVVQGRLDDTIAPDSGTTICEGVSSPVKEIHWLENSAHTVILDREIDAVVDLTMRFLDRILYGEAPS
jgi:carboxylesterase